MSFKLFPLLFLVLYSLSKKFSFAAGGGEFVTSEPTKHFNLKDLVPEMNPFAHESPSIKAFKD